MSFPRTIRLLTAFAFSLPCLLIPEFTSAWPLATRAPSAPFALSEPASGPAPTDSRALSFFHTHTDDEISICYWRDGTYMPESLARLDGFLADFRTGEETKIDPALFDLLHQLALATGTREPFQVISCYRCPKTNAALRSKSKAVAEKSLHMEGRAIDIRLADVPSDKLRDLAISLGVGGVGYYRDSDFVHVDTGRVRTW